MPDIVIAGATFNNVPSIDIPKSGGGTASFYAVDGSQTVTENGTYDVSALAQMIVNVSGGGGGATNFVSSTFTPTSAVGTVQEITIPYSGSGYPIAAMVYVTGGMYNPDVTSWYNVVKRYAVGFWAMSKCIVTTTPTYSTSGDENNGTILVLYKNSSSSARTYSASNAALSNLFTSDDPTANASQVVKFASKTKMKILVANTSYGFMQNLEYTYHIIYSS